MILWPLKANFQGVTSVKNSENLSFWPFFVFLVHKLWFLSEKNMPNDGLYDLNGILYVFRDSIAINGPFPGGNVGQKQ